MADVSHLEFASGTYDIKDAKARNEIEVLKQNNDYLTPEIFGAVGDGITNDYEAFKQCHECANKHNLEVHASGNYFIKPLNYFTVSTNIDFSKAKIRVDLNGLQDFGWFTPYKLLTVGTTEEKELILNGHYENYKNCIIRFSSNRVAIMRSGTMPIYEKDDLYIDDKGTPHGVMKYDYLSTDTIEFIHLNHYEWKLGKISFNDDTPLPGLNDWRRIGFYMYGTINSVIQGAQINSNISTAYSVYGLIVNCYSVNNTIENCVIPSLIKSDGSASYGLRFEECFYLTLKNLINSNTSETWSVMGSNYLYSLKVIDCDLSRIDCHNRLYNCDIANCNIKYISVSGGGTLNISNCIFNATDYCVQIRPDYGCEWNGNININNITVNTGNKLISISPNNVNYTSTNIIQCKRISIENVYSYTPLTVLYFGSRILDGVQDYTPPLKIDCINIKGESIVLMYMNTYYSRHANCPSISGDSPLTISYNAIIDCENCDFNMVNGLSIIQSDTQVASSWFFKSYTPLINIVNCLNIALAQNNLRTIISIYNSIISGLNLYRNEIETFIRLSLKSSTLCYDFATTNNILNGSLPKILWNNVIIDAPKKNGLYLDSATSLQNMYSNDIELKFLRNDPINTLYDCKLSDLFKSQRNNYITQQILKFTVGVVPVLNKRYGTTANRPASMTQGSLYYDTTLNCEVVYVNGYKNLIGQNV